MEGVSEGELEDPLGYIHFSKCHDENYLKQITAELLITSQRNGSKKTEWVASGPNHLLDCKVYSRAVAEHLGLSRMTTEEWIGIAKIRNTPPESIQGDLLALTTELKVAPKNQAQSSQDGEIGEGSNPSAGREKDPPPSTPADVPAPPSDMKPSASPQQPMASKRKRPMKRFRT